MFHVLKGIKQGKDNYDMENRQKANNHHVFFKTPVNKKQ